MEEYKDYYHQRTHLIVDGRAYNAGTFSSESGGMSIELEATPISESESLLRLENIVFTNGYKNFYNSPWGDIKKDYIIGIFALPQTEELPQTE